MPKFISDQNIVEINKEKNCIEDCLEMMKVYLFNNNFQLARERCLDVQKSLLKLKELTKDNQ